MTTYFADDAEIEELIRGFVELTLPKERWTHAAHFAGALWMMRHRGAEAASRDMPGLIRAYNESVGGVNSDTAGYHETITQASLRAAAPMLGDGPLHLALDRLMASSLGRSDWQFAYWSKDVLMSVEARRTWVEPDLRPLPF